MLTCATLSENGVSDRPPKLRREMRHPRRSARKPSRKQNMRLTSSTKSMLRRRNATSGRTSKCLCPPAFGATPTLMQGVRGRVPRKTTRVALKRHDMAAHLRPYRAAELTEQDDRAGRPWNDRSHALQGGALAAEERRRCCSRSSWLLSMFGWMYLLQLFVASPSNWTLTLVLRFSQGPRL